MGLETVDFDGLGIKLKTFLLVDKKFLDVFALISLELDHLTHLGVVDDSAIASCSGRLTSVFDILKNIPKGMQELRSEIDGRSSI